MSSLSSISSDDEDKQRTNSCFIFFILDNVMDVIGTNKRVNNNTLKFNLIIEEGFKRRIRQR